MTTLILKLHFKAKGGSFEIEYNRFKYQGKDKKNAYKLKEITKDEFIKWI